MTDAELADELLARLNNLIADPSVREDIGRLIEMRVSCGQATLDHPTIQASEPAGQGTLGLVGFLGVLNGLVGVLPNGPKSGWGYITAVFDDDMKLVSFERT